MQVLLGIDVGKTNLRVAVFRTNLTLVDRWLTPSPDVSAALNSLRLHLLALNQRYSIAAVGLSTFGPLATNPAHADFGAISESSDPLWTAVNLPAHVSATLRTPVFFDYDVNTGALAEALLGAGRGSRSFFYLSVGTGIGGTLYRSGLTAGYAPQFGHTFLPREPDDLDFSGSCRFHDTCLQGLASGRALERRWGVPPERLPPDHPAWDLEARYLARACVNLVYSFSPERIVLGSSISAVPGLIPGINRHLVRLLQGFLEPELQSLFAAQPPVVQASLAPDSSLVGAALLARDQSGLPLLPSG